MRSSSQLNGYRVRPGLTLLFLLAATLLHGQQIADSVYFVCFKDKAGNGYEVDKPKEFLSDRSLNRRAWQGLTVDQTDEPVTAAYVEELINMGATIRHVSKWLNGVAIVHASDSLFRMILEKPFADTIPWQPDTVSTYMPPVPVGSRFEMPLSSPPFFDYGVAAEQVQMLKMDFMHNKGYTGRGVWIAVLDAGFRNADSLPAFESMIADGRLLGTRNFVNEKSVFRQDSHHGMMVLSIIGAEWNGNLVGTAPHASYYLCMTEDPVPETRIEEIAWIEAAEFVDSMGFDLINTSLGYSDFDSTRFDYTYGDMDGQTTFISRAASLTASKGMIACTSAGNEGNKPWYFITAPADAHDILAVGALDSTRNIAQFSSRGPSSDGRIKPDVSAMGSLTGIQGIHGAPTRGYGTSFSSPVITGSVASLWQAFPGVPAKQLIRMVRESSDRIEYPDQDYGNGVPNFALAYWGANEIPVRFTPGAMEIYPNPATHYIMVRLPERFSGRYPLRFIDLSGRVMDSMEVDVPGGVSLPSTLREGMYILEMRTDRGVYRSRLIIK